jgi:RimJ/RimL family protein N-acetyltransferase
MTTARGTVTYEFRVEGQLDDHWSAWLAGLALTRQDGTTTLVGPVQDQAQLHGVLARLRDIGATLLSLRRVEATAWDARADGHGVRRAGACPGFERTVSTGRLTLRAATPDDVEATFAYRQLESVGRWLTEIPTDLETYRASFTDPARLATTVIAESGGTLIGDLTLRVKDASAQAEVIDRSRGSQAELGWVLDPAHTGRGYATEALRALIRGCFEHLGVRRVLATCFVGDDTSWRLMERVGMRRETYAVRESLHRSGEWLDTVTYALLADEQDLG